MKSKIKYIFVVIILLVSVSFLYPMKFSLGFSYPLFTADFINKDNKMYNSLYYFGFPFMTPVSLNTMFEFNPYVALEASVGFSLFYYPFIHIPVLARFQYDFKVGVFYAALGPKFVFISGPFDKYNWFLLYINFALGLEFRVSKINYIGFRVGYDYNIPYNKESDLSYIDRVSLTFTYRYEF